jgi:hypothetical protein
LPQTQPPCGTLAKIIGTVQNVIADDINHSSGSIGADFLFGAGTQILYGCSNITLSSRLQPSLSYTTSNSLDGYMIGAIAAGGYGVGRSRVPATTGNSQSIVAVGGAAVMDFGAVGSGSMDENSFGLPLPSMNARGEWAEGFGAGGASGQGDTTTYALPPLIPAVPTSTCHFGP